MLPAEEADGSVSVAVVEVASAVEVAAVVEVAVVVDVVAASVALDPPCWWCCPPPLRADFNALVAD